MESSRKLTMKNGVKGESHKRRYHSLIWILCVVTGMLIGVPSGATPQDIPVVIIDISFDMQQGLMKGKSAITLPQGKRYIGIKGLRMLTMKLDGIPITPVVTEGAFRIEAREGSILDMTYECPSAEGSPCVIGKDGIVLLDNWYPSIEGLAFYKLSASVPGNFQAVSEAEEVVIQKVQGGSRFTFEFPHPLEGVHFIAGNYTVKEESYHGVEIFTYFFPVDAGLAESYMEHTKKYLDLYLRLIGDFPYKRFSIVENLMPTGYSMPTFTLLGQEVVRLPFIVRTSLGHEILHQWIGNLVYVDYDSGNWSEGLTTYLSDHLYEEMAGRGWEYRKQILLDYETYVTPEKDFPLTEFRSRTDFASKAIGYGKAAMVFHMLRNLSGDQVFFEALREFIGRERFKQASWDDIKRAFEKVSGKDIGWFFSQWISEKGSPSIVVTPKEISPRGLRSALFIGITQGEKKYILDIPSVVKTDQGETAVTLRIGQATEGLEVVADGNPERLIIDGGYDTFRRLSEKEMPPRIAQILSEEKGILVLPRQGREDPVYSDAISFFEGRKFVVRNPNSVKERELRSITAVVLGFDNWIARRLFGGIDNDSQGLVFTVKMNPLNLLKAIAFLHANSGEDMKATLEKIMHYGKYSTVSFRKVNNVEKKIDESERGWVIALLEPTFGVEESKELSLNEIIDRVSGKKIVYVGEEHDQYSSHLTELEVIRGLFRKGGRIAIGMEMFARPFQKALDDYIRGTIGEREFLRSSDYFKQWGFDYNLYQDILRFAREERIPVAALNIRKEIVGKVAKGGIDFLTPEEKKELPENMDLTDEQYRGRLRTAFAEHEGFGERSFENFYQSQIIWDEIMAQNIDEFMKSHPEYRMVVLAGSGHIAYGSGIPKRAYRRNGLDYAIILNEGPVERGIADYTVFPKPVIAVTAPKLMVMLREEKDGLAITGFLPHSASEKAGLRKGDRIVALDGEKVKDMQEIRIALFFKKKGETLRMTVLRKKFLLGERALDVEVTL
jgi:aminopeptidase N